VQIDCSELTTEQAAEIESRVRASLLTTEGDASVAIACRSDGADVRVERGPESVVVTALATPAGFRDDVLRAVEQALEQLLRRQARPPQASSEGDAHDGTPAPLASPEPTPLPATAPSARPITTAPPPDRKQAPQARRWTEISSAFVGESWSERPALGGSLGAARNARSLWYGLRIAALRPVTQAPSFSAVEAQVAAELGVQPDFAAGVRFSLALGPSVLFVQPQGGFTSRSGNAKTSLFAAIYLSRPIWLGRWALLPDLGVRLFARERGVNVDTEQQLALAGFAPQLSLGVAYRID
jgi:hypothetical protein